MQMQFKLSSVIPDLNYSFLPHVLSFSSTFQPKYSPHQIGPPASKLTNLNCDKIMETEFVRLELLQRALASSAGAHRRVSAE